ncbi:MAG: nucleotidyltransferase domain-containing protein, partial [Psychrobium sp.]|nr:nucleotidyltransferase domain-containing protein [Psychrobium sp.]
MNIDRNEIIAGLPAVEARDLIAKLIWIHSGFTLNDLAKRLKIKKPIAHKYVEAFESEGYLKPFDGQDSKKRWVTTIKGNALAQASAAKRFKRATADKHYDLFLKRVSEINSNAKFLYQVSKVAVFGSYLTNSPTVGDIDLFVWIELKKEFSEQFPQIHEQRTKE